MVGTVTLVYGHEMRKLSEMLISLQHHHCQEIISATHIHLDEYNCREVLIVRGEEPKDQGDRRGTHQHAGGEARQGDHRHGRVDLCMRWMCGKLVLSSTSQYATSYYAEGEKEGAIPDYFLLDAKLEYQVLHSLRAI